MKNEKLKNKTNIIILSFSYSKIKLNIIKESNNKQEINKIVQNKLKYINNYFHLSLLIKKRRKVYIEYNMFCKIISCMIYNLYYAFLIFLFKKNIYFIKYEK
ncbi:hypothetical protein PFUGPA_00742 [Plasmodium falciparum Palo Alto/Uganda]|uniref:Uncharacterized protein n=2 Tax=Plasmodium falciparum TaxID=5833 RepID=W4J4T6_PLAFP|nr:hypothetical protein PFNF135_01769 [Plasmodium falciparum NF135/5.C10]ETW57255.1 hypothetical protein PFUGPA_00742 [Plasmodium falciparum Palo Alto/Uganda]